MKLKLKMKLMAAAVALVAATGANAAIINSQGGNGELFFTIYDMGADLASKADDRAYVRDLSSLANGGTISLWGSTTTSPSVTLAADKQATGTIYSVAADANLQSFLAASTDTSRLMWNIAAVDSSGTDRLLTTATSISTKPIYADFRGYGVGADIYLAAMNPALTAESAVYAGADSNISKWNSTIGGRATFNKRCWHRRFAWFLHAVGNSCCRRAHDPGNCPAVHGWQHPNDLDAGRKRQR